LDFKAEFGENRTPLLNIFRLVPIATLPVMKEEHIEIEGSVIERPQPIGGWHSPLALRASF
jgi:hypothetical protein